MATDKSALRSIDDLTAALKFRDEDEKACFATAALGQEAINFFNTTFGMAIRAYAYQEIKLAQTALVNCDAADTNQVRKLQMQANVPGLFLAFVQEAIANGEQAYAALRERESEHLSVVELLGEQR
jgi:hypothetical protein